MDINITYHGDCLDLIPKHIEDKSIDVILADLPFGTTNCKWDIPIQLNDYIEIFGKTFLFDDYLIESYKKNINYDVAKSIWDENHKKGLWHHNDRIIKDNGVILLFAQIPFNITLGFSNMKELRYEWIWEKTHATGHLNAKKMPMKAHENVLVFYMKLPTYNPQKTIGHIRKVSAAKNRANCIIRRNDTNNIYNNEYPDKVESYDSTERYPRSIQCFSTDKQKSNLHKTQKPLKLIKYLIETYSNEGDIILDYVAGSGTTGLAAKELNRNYIMMEKDHNEYLKCCNRVNYKNK
jgi:site-specific DNA-methyltransferase (adenine-specific)